VTGTAGPYRRGSQADNSEPYGSNESIWIVYADGSGLVQVTDGTDDNPDWEAPRSAT
jgi:hypothetical protein